MRRLLPLLLLALCASSAKGQDAKPKETIMRRMLLMLAFLFFAGPAQAQADDFSWMTPRCKAKAERALTQPDQNAVLYALPSSTPDGCYASGSTALARDASGAGVAMTFARNAVAYFPDTPANGWWRSCPANQLRVSGQWTGAILDANGTNLFATPTDSPTSTAPWSLIAAGPTLTANNGTYPFLDGTSTGTTITESAGVVTGIQQTVTVSSAQYCQHAIFQSGPSRACWGYSLDGTTVHAKFNIFQGSVTYVGSGVKAGIEYLGNGFTRPWACATLTAGSVTPQFFATAACDDNTKAATGATAVTQIIARTMFQGAIGNTASQATTYSPAGTARPLDELLWPVSLANGNVCASIKYEPYGASADARSTSGLVSLYGPTATWQAANSAALYYSPTQVTWAVTDAAGAVRTVIGNIPVGLGPHTYKGCTSTTGAMSLYVDGAVMTNASGAGTGILTDPPTKVYVGTLAGSGSYVRTATGAFSDLAVCNLSDPILCGDGSRPAPASMLAVGDSITAGVGISGVTTPWSAVAANLNGVNIAMIARGSWQSAHALAAYQANRGHRWKKVAVLIGSNDLSVSGQAFDTIRQIYAAIIADGAIPVPMTILPRGANEAIRQDLNKAILNWCQMSGYTCADIASIMEDPANPGHLKAAYFNVGDETHPNQTGHNAMGAFMAPYLQ